jgi:hypothetical protein
MSRKDELKKSLFDTLPVEWKEFCEIEKFAQLDRDILKLYETQTVFPAIEHVFRAFELCRLDEVKVIIIGQDPYHTPGQAKWIGVFLWTSIAAKFTQHFKRGSTFDECNNRNPQSGRRKPGTMDNARRIAVKHGANCTGTPSKQSPQKRGGKRLHITSSESCYRQGNISW